jgi:hypothetical protein
MYAIDRRLITIGIYHYLEINMAAMIGVQPDQRRSLTDLFFHTARAKKGIDIIIPRKRKVLNRVSENHWSLKCAHSTSS